MIDVVDMVEVSATFDILRSLSDNNWQLISDAARPRQYFTNRDLLS